MNIIYHLPCAIVGGAETQLLYLANIVSESHEVMITYEYPQIEAFLFKNFKTKNFYRITSPILLAKKIAEFKPDIIQYYHCPTIYNYLGKINLGNTKVVEVAHNRTSFPTDCSTYAKDRTDVLVCVSQSAKDHYITKRGEDVPMTIIPNGIDTDVFVPKTPSTPKPILTGGYCGRFEAGNGKGVKMLIDLVSDLPVKFELVGYDFGNHKERLKRTQNIKFYQHTNNIVSYYHKWDFFVSCSPAEGFGLAIAEALACGLPCVILDCGGICNYLTHRKHAYIAKDQDDVANGIREIIAGARYEPLSIDFGSRKMADMYINLYEALANKPSVASLAPLRPAMTPPREYTLGVVPNNWYGIKQSLERRCDGVCEPHSLMKEVRKHQPTQVVFGGFLPEWIHQLRALRQLSSIYITIQFHGTALIGDFDQINRDGLVAAIGAMKDDLADCISTPHEGMARMFNLLYKVRAVYEKNKIELIQRPDVEKLAGMHVGIFGTGLPWKNVNSQILGAAMTPGLGMTHLQNLHHPELMKQLRIPYRVHPYYQNRADFFKLAAQMTLNLAVTTTEAFGYLPLESFMLGVPAIVSSTTPSFRGVGGYAKKCIVNYIDDPAAISDAIQDVMENYDEVLEDGMKHVRTLL